MTRQFTSLIIGIVALAGCTQEEPPARSVDEFVENPMMLEATVVRCAMDRSTTKYDQECINARDAVSRIEAKSEEARSAELEARSAEKRQALRRTQQAKAEARRRAEESARLREEAEYLAQFGVLPPQPEDRSDDLPEGNTPLAVVPTSQATDTPTDSYGDALPAVDGGNAPGAAPAPAEEPAADLEDVREELQRRNDDT